MSHRFSRSELLIGKEGLEKLRNSHITIFGIGGVGSYTVEALVRCGVGSLTLVDFDDICLTNINRQIHALSNTVGKAKVEMMKQRVFDINPECSVTAVKEFVTPDNIQELIYKHNTYVVDAIDNVTGKLAIIKYCKSLNIDVISAMGAGNKLDPGKLEITDISKTSICPLARVMRRELKKSGIIAGIKVVYSPEQPLKPNVDVGLEEGSDISTDHVPGKKHKQVPGSISFVPSVAGLLIAGEVVNDIIKIDTDNN